LCFLTNWIVCLATGVSGLSQQNQKSRDGISSEEVPCNRSSIDQDGRDCHPHQHWTFTRTESLLPILGEESIPVFVEGSYS